MASKAIQRTLLVIVLIVTAHVLKPFSIRSMTKHLLRSANSFSFILPDGALCTLEQADYLARVLDGSFERVALPQAGDWNSYSVTQAKLPALARRQVVNREVRRDASQVRIKRSSLAKSSLPRVKEPELACHREGSWPPV